MKVVFLDIDGVVNTLQIDENLKPYYGTEQTCPNNIQALRWLSRLCLEQNAKIVISSTWRHAGLQRCRETLYKGGLSTEIEIIDTTPTYYGEQRGKEIYDWLRFHPEVKKFVILDDDSDMEPLMDYLVKCDHHQGFLGEEYTKATDLLSDD